jgi:hypothetical protein
LSTGERFDTRVIVGILPETICGASGNQIDFEVNYDTQLGFAVVTPNATIYQNNIFDNIGLFKNPAWINNPNLVFRVSQTTLAKPIPRVDLTQAVLV